MEGAHRHRGQSPSPLRLLLLLLLAAAAGCYWLLLAGRLEGVLLLPIIAVNNQKQVKEPARNAFSPAEPEKARGDLEPIFKSKY